MMRESQHSDDVASDQGPTPWRELVLLERWAERQRVGSLEPVTRLYATAPRTGEKPGRGRVADIKSLGLRSERDGDRLRRALTRWRRRRAMWRRRFGAGRWPGHGGSRPGRTGEAASDRAKPPGGGRRRRPRPPPTPRPPLSQAPDTHHPRPGRIRGGGAAVTAVAACG